MDFVIVVWWYLFQSYYNESSDLTILKNMIFDDFHYIFFRYQFWHRFLMSCCIDFGSMLAPQWHKNPSCLAIVFWWFWGWPGWFSYRFWSKMASQNNGGPTPFSLFFRSCSAGSIFEGSLAHFGSLLIPFRLHVGSFGYPFDSSWIF